MPAVSGSSGMPPRCAEPGGPGRRGWRAASARVRCTSTRGSGLSLRSGERLLRRRGRAAQRTGQPAVAVKRLAEMLVAGAAHEREPGVHLGDEGVQRGRAVQQRGHGRAVGVGGLLQSRRRRAAPPGPGEPPGRHPPAGRTSGRESEHGSGPARCRARSRGPHRRRGSAASPGSRRRSRRAARRSQRRVARHGRPGQGTGRAPATCAAPPG